MRGGEESGGAVLVTYTFLLRLAGMQCNRRNAETIQISCRFSRPMFNFYGYWTADGGVGTEATFLNAYTVLLSISSLPEQYKKPTDLSETSVTISGHSDVPRGELSYLAPLGSENISAPYFKQCFFRGGVLPPQTVKHHASQYQDRNNKYFILYIEFCINNKI